MKPDHINGLFELIGGTLLILNCRRMYVDKEVKGVSIIPCVFFTSWGYWNLFFYPALNAWWSFYGAILVAITNSMWLGMVWYYRKFPNLSPKDAEKPVSNTQTGS